VAAQVMISCYPYKLVSDLNFFMPCSSWLQSGSIGVSFFG
jgi:hypothetical protein